MYYIGLFLGVLVATRLSSSLLLWLTKTWDGGMQRLCFVHVVSLVSLGFLESLNGNYGGDYVGIEAVGRYLIPQIIWFFFDVYCFYQRKVKLQKYAVITCGVTMLLALGVLVFIAAIGTSLDTTFEQLNKALDTPSSEIVSVNANQKVVDIMLHSVTLPYTVDDKMIIMEIVADDTVASIVFDISDDIFQATDEEKVFWNEYFCENSNFFKLITEGANIKFLYFNYSENKLLDNFSINCN